MTLEEGIAIWVYLGAHCTGAQLTEAQLELRAAELVPLEFDQAMATARDWIHRAKWMPSTGEFWEACISPKLPTPDEVWEEVRALVRRYGWPEPPVEAMCSPAAWSVIRAIGWDEICEGHRDVIRAHVLKEVAPRAIERLRRDLLTGPIWPTLSPGETATDALEAGDER